MVGTYMVAYNIKFKDYFEIANKTKIQMATSKSDINVTFRIK